MESRARGSWPRRAGTQLGEGLGPLRRDRMLVKPGRPGAFVRSPEPVLEEHGQHSAAGRLDLVQERDGQGVRRLLLLGQTGARSA